MPLPYAKPDLDPIIRLHDYYFQPADLMYEHVEKLRFLLEKNGRLSNNNLVKLQSYFKLWLATLYVVAEGFQNAKAKEYFLNSITGYKNIYDLSLKVHWNSIHHKIEQLENKLKAYRYITLHFQPSHTRLLEKRSGCEISVQSGANLVQKA